MTMNRELTANGWVVSIPEPEISGSISPDQIEGITSVGTALLTATDAAAGRTAIGAGTSNLALGTTATTALAGNGKAASATTADTATTATTATSAAKLTTARTVALTGAVTGTGSFDGSANLSIATTSA